MELLKTVLEIIGAVTTLISILLFFWAVVCWIMGIYPLLSRLGFARWSRKIAVIAKDEMYNSLKTDLIDTAIFRDKNISQISSNSFAKIKESSLALIHYQSFTEDEIKTILSNKKSNAGFVFYFPEFSPPQKVIPPEMMKLINNEQFTIVVNMRGRLMNDLLVMLLSTSYEKR